MSNRPRPTERAVSSAPPLWRSDLNNKSTVGIPSWPWQQSGAPGILGSSRVPLAEMVKLDYLYVASWSLWSDIKILLGTVPYMLARREI